MRRRRPFWSIERACRITEWAVLLVLSAGMWWCFSPAVGVGYFVVLLLLSVKRMHCWDFGRFTIIAGRISPTVRTPIVGLSWVLHTTDRTGPKAGLDLVIGRVGMAAYTLMPREKWAEFKHNRAKGHTRMVDPS